MPKKTSNPEDVPFSVQLRLTPEEKTRLMIIAIKKGKTLSQWISQELKDYLAKKTDDIQ
ncbi:hypothetical protein [Cylindrospermopsis curvispora]|jgi:predicted HicB family RNase H-like nuclease|uniref:Uncharacterized protein n=1 Tax=Cylindrospermopsis curvispora GIHE-G1 TaxID=2666332 RepID=A0A7H0F5W2_9CYAN|nr:hypothetical protein [Cylindrospermopsis curvispora]QNP31428.1 hypothetical protein IAR63_17725 [Cylindrospermopsis curvispora GIHE-G1]